MRKDMSKVIVETYRGGRGMARAVTGIRRKYRNKLDIDGEGGRSRIGMRRDIFIYWYFNEQSDHVSPLERYIRKQVGRPWDEVYGEVCAAADGRSVIHWHLRLHLMMYVEVDTVWLDGQVVLPAHYRWRPIAESTSDVYVHPVTRLLIPVDRRRRHSSGSVVQSGL